MYSFEEWDKIVDAFEDTNAIVTCTDGSVYEGEACGYCESENDDGTPTWGILMRVLSNNSSGMMEFIRSDVSEVKLLN